MRIGYFITHYPYERHYANYLCGGMEVAASSLATKMAEKGHEISVFTTSIDSKDYVERSKNLSIYRYGASFKIAQANMSLALMWKPMGHEMDIIHAHAGNPPAPIAALRYARRNKKPLVVTYHMDAEANWGGIVRRTGVFFYNTFLLKSILSKAASVTTPSQNFLDSSKFLTVYKDKVTVVPNGIDADSFIIPYSKEECRKKLGLADESSILLFVGALSPHKNPEVIIRAIPALKHNIKNIRLLFVGEGVLKNQLQKISRELGVEDQVTFLDFIDNQEHKAMLYKSADVFVLPSTQESFGIVILEAMACGIPVVATTVGGITNLVQDGQTGLLVPPQNSEILTKTIEKLLGDFRLRQKLAEEGKKLVWNYSWSKIADQTETLYQEVMK